MNQSTRRDLSGGAVKRGWAAASLQYLPAIRQWLKVGHPCRQGFMRADDEIAPAPQPCRNVGHDFHL
jgi:hypothetical protein